MDTRPKRVRIPHLLASKREGRKIAILTAYDYTMARLVDQAGVDAILVGDSLGNVMLGYDTTLPVTLEDMIHHGRAVRRGAQRALVIVDMPFGSYQAGVDQAVDNAVRLMKETGADAVKVEGGRPIVPAIRRMTEIGIPVMGHLGFTPQSVHQMGGYRVQGRSREDAEALLEDARAVEAAGAFALVLELIPPDLSAEVTRALTIPTIGIGAGPHCDGQVLVLQDMLGMFDDFQPKFVRRFAEVGSVIRGAVAQYVQDVAAGRFPAPEHTVGGARREEGSPS